MLSEMTGIPLGTLSKILAGISDSPKLSNVVAICDALGCSLDYIILGIPENHNNFTLDAGEIRLVENYRKLDTHGKELCALVVDKELQRVTCSEYSEKSGAKVLSADEVRARIAEAGASKHFGKRAIRLYELPVSAGIGEFLDESSSVFADEDAGERIYIPDNSKTAEADFALKISGNSMEPKYKDGDILLVTDCDSVEVGEPGIFLLDGSGYFKIFGGDRLISLNKSYGDIMLKDFQSVWCGGRVIGKLKRR
jgi:phage repressor protein C with HTH and peptisase S24 domain/DNA-binding Xre family transcriptional regulator